MKCINHPDTEAKVVCIGCGKPICNTCKVDSSGEAYCKNCISEKVSSKTTQEKSPVLALILSIIIGGLGQVYNGQIGKGLLIFFTTWLIIPWIYGIIDAYRTAKKINSGEITVPKRTGCTVAAIVFMLITPFCIAIMALLAAIAIPSFISARETARANLCRNNLRLLYQVKQQYAADNNLAAYSTIPYVDNNGIDDNDDIPDAIEEYFAIIPICPNGGKYTIGTVNETPSCSTGNKNTKWTDDDHILKEEPRI